MNMNYLLIGSLIGLILISHVAIASSPYGKMDVYYNDKLLPGKEVAKPVLKIGEPFNVGINLTVYQKCYFSVMLSEIGNNDFEIITGSTSKMKDYETEILDENFTKMYEWTVRPTGNWAGGSIPINLVYQINDFETGESLVEGKFTIAYCTISNEHYQGETPTSEQPKSENQSTSKKPASENSSSPASAPAFSLITAILALVLVFLRFSRQ
jgi:MAST domain-containing protein